MAVEHAGMRDVPVSDLVQLPGNPRRGNVGEIRKSVARLGQYRAVVVRDTGDALVILAGNHTVQAITAEGGETARCEVIRCTDEEARRIALADNRLGEMPDPITGKRYDDEALAELIASLDGDLDGTGWAVQDLDRDPLPEPGDAPTGGGLDERWGVIVECESEAEQLTLLEDLGGQGWRVRALIV